MQKFTEYLFSNNFILILELVILSLIIFYGIIYLQGLFESCITLCDGGGSSDEFVSDSNVGDSLEEKAKFIRESKKDFRQFYTTYRSSIKLSDLQLEKLNHDLAISSWDNGKGEGCDTIIDWLPYDIHPLYKKFLLNKLKTGRKI